VRILVFNRSRLEQPSAQAINVVHTCAALARAGATVVLHADVGNTDPAMILEYYGAKAPSTLSFRNMGWRWHSMALRLVAGPLLGARTGEPTVVFLREVRPYVATLVEAARRRRHRIAFEAHNAAGKMALEAASRTELTGGVAGLTAPPRAMVSSAAMAGAGGASGNPGGGVQDNPSAAVAVAERNPGRSPAGAAGNPAPNGTAWNGNGPGAAAAAEERAALERSILSRVDYLVAPQRLTLDAIRGLVRAGVPNRVVPNGTPVPPSIESNPKEIDILYLGSLTAWKGVDTLVAAMPQLYPYKLSIVGGREEKHRHVLQQMALQLGCAERVEFVPPVRPAEVWKLYARAKVGVVPLSAAFLEAREYTCPLKLLEMMAAGLPIVTSRVPSVREYVREGEDVLMAKSDDPGDFAATIRRLLEDQDLATRLAASARAKAGDLSYEHRARRLLDLFSEPLPADA
jgi:hypothetical protein